MSLIRHKPKLNKLHICPSDAGLDGWVNTAIDPKSARTIKADPNNRFPFSANAFSHVFVNFALEHVEFLEGLSLLAECARVLQPGGKIRIATTDLKFILDLYKTRKLPIQKKYIRWFVDSYTRVNLHWDTFVINHLMRRFDHKFIYDEKTLAASLDYGGFTKVVRLKPRQSHDKSFQGLENLPDTPKGFLELTTLCIEAIKPF